MVDLKKEKEPLSGMERVRIPEDVVTVEAPKDAKQNLETQSWMEKIERRFARVPNKTSDVTDDTVVVQQAQAQQPPVTLPINQNQIQVGKNASPDTGIAWLVAWAIRQIKLFTKLGRNVRLQDIPVIEDTTKPTK